MSDSPIRDDLVLVVPETPEEKRRSLGFNKCSTIRSTTRKRLFGDDSLEGKKKKLEGGVAWEHLPNTMASTTTTPNYETLSSVDIVYGSSAVSTGSSKLCSNVTPPKLVGAETSKSCGNVSPPKVATKTVEERIKDQVWEFYFNFMLPEHLKKKYKSVDHFRYGISD